jgi:hypothetical protein
MLFFYGVFMPSFDSVFPSFDDWFGLPSLTKYSNSLSWLQRKRNKIYKSLIKTTRLKKYRPRSKQKLLLGIKDFIKYIEYRIDLFPHFANELGTDEDTVSNCLRSISHWSQKKPLAKIKKSDLNHWFDILWYITDIEVSDAHTSI